MILIGVICFLVIVALMLPFATMGQKESKAHQNRRCPICGSHLAQDDRLFADQQEKQSGPHQLTIKGCTHCYEK